MVLVMIKELNSSTRTINCCNEWSLLHCGVISIVFSFLEKLIIRCNEWTLVDVLVILFHHHSQNTNNWVHCWTFWDPSFQRSSNVFWYILHSVDGCVLVFVFDNKGARNFVFYFFLLMFLYFSNDCFLLNGYLLYSEVCIE